MLDENLPTFFIKPFTENQAQSATLYLSQYGSEPHPAYTLRRPDPSLETSRNCYAVALFDSFNPDVLYGEVLIRPQWSTPTASAADIRRNGNVIPPPEPIIPTDFTIHLYAPDQQVHVRQKAGSWVGGSGSWEFDLPQNTFRQPSASDLDRSRDDPAVAETTPRYCFRWKRDGKLSKDLVCLMSGRSNDPTSKKKKNALSDPDIAVALFKSLREVTVYEPNLSRIEIEDPKGFEVVMLLSAAVIRDVFFGNTREAFNISAPTPRRASASGGETTPPTGRNRGASLPSLVGTSTPNPATTNASSQRLPLASPHPPPPSQRHPPPSHPLPSPPAASIPNPAASMPHAPIHPAVAATPSKAQIEADRRAKARAEEAEMKRIRKMLEAEAKEARRRQAEVDRETERLRKLYGDEQRKAAQQVMRRSQVGGRPGPAPAESLTSATLFPPRAQSVPPPRMDPVALAAATRWPEPAAGRPSPRPGPGTIPPRAHAVAGHLTPHSNNAHAGANSSSKRPGGGGEARRTTAPKRSMWGLRSRSDDMEIKLNKKRSSIF
ncbi:MAG: hypothetical protein M1823_000451 [Watsoniomyces obsoletus]|nr:MAG: hypothetical protein M1823_000451 [Watsoniomyces obsoletus]